MEAWSNPYHQVQPMEVPSNRYLKIIKPYGGFLRPEEVCSAHVLHTPQRAPRMSPSGDHEYERDKFVICRQREGYFCLNQA